MVAEAKRAINFGAGPAKLPEKVLKQASEDIINWRGTGVGILEVSHRSPEFMALMRETEERLRRLVHIPDDYAVLFMAGGGTLQFSAIVQNLVRRDPSKRCVDYIKTGAWSTKAAQEAKRLLAGTGIAVREIQVLKEQDEQMEREKQSKTSTLPTTISSTMRAASRQILPPEQWDFSPNDTAHYVYYCDNETIDGVEMPSASHVARYLEGRDIGAPLVADMSSNFMTRPIDVRRFGLIFATAQKNFGPAGITVVIVRRQLINSTLPPSLLSPLPLMMDYAIQEESGSLYNTPVCFAIHMSNLVFAWLEERFNGDLANVDEFSRAKSALIYRCIEESEGFYRSPIPPLYRSRVNIVFRVWTANGIVDVGLEDKFVKEAEKCGLLQLRGHRSVGGIRVSLYNALTFEETIHAVEFMRQFAQTHAI